MNELEKKIYHKNYYKKWSKKNREKLRIKERKWNKENKLKKDKLNHKYYLQNREYYLKKKKEYNVRNQDKIKMYGKINYLFRKMGFKLTECSICNSKSNLIKHHENYSRPLDILVLCRGCHNRLHKMKYCHQINQTVKQERCDELGSGSTIAYVPNKLKTDDNTLGFKLRRNGE